MNETIKLRKKSLQEEAEPRAPDNLKRYRQKENGVFRTLSESSLARAAPFKGYQAKDEGLDTQRVLFRRLESSEFAELSLGEDENHQRLLLGSMKKGSQRALNTSYHKSVNMNRAKPLFGKAYTTFSDKEGTAFCHCIEETAKTEHFMRYLEAAALESETKSVAQVFPFLDSKADRSAYQQLLDKRSALQSVVAGVEKNLALKQLEVSLESLREKLYTDQMKRVQFKKKLDLLLKAEPQQVATESEKDFWFWQWLLKIKRFIEEEMEVFKQNTE